MSNAFIFYLINFFTGIWMLAFVGMLGSLFYVFLSPLLHTLANNEEQEAMVVKWKSRCSKIFIGCLILVTIMPSTKTMYLMAGTSWLDKSTLLPKVLRELENKIDESLKEDK